MDLNKFFDALTATVADSLNSSEDNKKKATTVIFSTDGEKNENTSEEMKAELNRLREELRRKVGDEQFDEINKKITEAAHSLSALFNGIFDGIAEESEKKENVCERCGKKPCECGKKSPCNCNDNEAMDKAGKHYKKNCNCSDGAIPIYNNSARIWKKQAQQFKNNAHVKPSKDIMMSIADKLRKELSEQPTQDEVVARKVCDCIIKKLKTPGEYILHKKTNDVEGSAEVCVKYSEIAVKTNVFDNSYLFETIKDMLIKETGVTDVYMSLNDPVKFVVYLTL